MTPKTYDPKARVSSAMFSTFANPDLSQSRAFWNSTPITSPPLNAIEREEIHPTTGEWSLTEPLVKPLHHFSELELEGLLRELQDTGYEQRENAIAEMTRNCILRYQSDHKQGGSYSSLYYGAPFRYDAPFRVGNKSLRFTVTIPSWLPDKWVQPFAERMIRDQIEEAS